MKRKIVAVTALMVGLSSFVNANSVYSPSKGVICDKKSGFCTDSYGISMGLTKEYLGEAAQNKLMKYKDLDTTAFTMSNGLSCDTRKKICKKSKWDDKADAHWTAVLFGKKASHHKGQGGTDLVQAAKDCKNHLAGKYGLPMAAFSVSKGHPHHGKVFVPVSIKWDEPFVDERGECKVHNGNISYKRISK